jgi:uncharacterized protein
MKHMTRLEASIMRLLDRARTIAIVGASPRPERHSHTVFRYLRSVGYDVVPVRADRRAVDGLVAYARLEDVPGAVDVVVVFRRRDAAPMFIAAAASKKAEAVWLPPGVWTGEAETEAMRHGIVIIKDRCIEKEHQHVSGVSGHPLRTGVWTGRRGRASHEDNRKRRDESGYVASGGGGSVAAGGKRTVLDEKKMVRGRPSPRRGQMKSHH